MRYKLWQGNKTSKTLKFWFYLCAFVTIGIFGAGIWIGIAEPAFIPYPDKPFIGAIAIVIALFLATPFLFQFLFARWRQYPWLTIFLELNFFLIIGLGSAGSFGLYEIFPEFDTLLHGFVTLQTAIILGLVFWILSESPPHFTSVFLVALIGSIIFLLLWEFLEYALDGLTEIDFFLTQGELDDFRKDLWADLAGALVGSFIALLTSQPLARMLKNHSHNNI
ncbi:hypothetical protein ACFL1U_03115 [Patescibacteria group bacterium]